MLLFELALLLYRHMLQGTTTTAAGQRTKWLLTVVGCMHNTGTNGIHAGATAGQHPGADLLARQSTGDKPGAPGGKGYAAAIVRQPLNAQLLLVSWCQSLACWLAPGLKAQAARFFTAHCPGPSNSALEK